MAGVATGLAGLAACKPPPTDAGLDRELPEAEPAYASDPLPSPDTEGAMWARSSEGGRIIYGVPGEPAIMALECVDTPAASPAIRITRLSPADEGAGALLAMVGNGAIARVPVDAVEQSGRFVWQGEMQADSFLIEPLTGPRALTVTVPGAGMVTLNPSAQPARFVQECRSRASAEPGS
ncbi:MAG: hypothetical protein AAFR88_12280 [Pseudomonadota bacterium]